MFRRRNSKHATMSRQQWRNPHNSPSGKPGTVQLPIAPSTYVRHHAQHLDATTRSARARRDDELRVEIRRVRAEHFDVYGPRKVWRQLKREQVTVARARSPA